jgi:NADH:ubiquinone oxidoreductase subunit F (NADH-binding)
MIPHMEAPLTISKQDCAETLYLWLSEHLADKEVRAMAGQIGFRLKGWIGIGPKKKLYRKFHSELFSLNMYLIVFTCETAIADPATRNNVLHRFHKLVYGRNIKLTGISYVKWTEFMKLIYAEYTRSMEEKSLLTPVLLIAQAFELNLFGKSVLDSYVRFEIGMRIGGMIQQLSKLLQGYVIRN